MRAERRVPSAPHASHCRSAKVGLSDRRAERSAASLAIRQQSASGGSGGQEDEAQTGLSPGPFDHAGEPCSAINPRLRRMTVTGVANALRTGAGFRTTRPNFVVYLVAVGGVHPDFAAFAFSIDSLNSCAVMAVRILVLG